VGEASPGDGNAAGGTELEIRVLYTAMPVDAARAWTQLPCRARSILWSGESQYYYENPEGWSILLAAPFGTDLSVQALCEFTDLFVSRFQFFRAVQDDSPIGGSPGRAPAFPAILIRAQ
jgi:hypothetical protein